MVIVTSAMSIGLGSAHEKQALYYISLFLKRTAVCVKEER